MKQDVFNYTFSEWRRQEKSYFENLAGGDLFSCPACSTTPHAIHIDGNMKLYRYNRKNLKTRLAKSCVLLFLNIIKVWDKLNQFDHKCIVVLCIEVLAKASVLRLAIVFSLLATHIVEGFYIQYTSYISGIYSHRLNVKSMYTVSALKLGVERVLRKVRVGTTR